MCVLPYVRPALCREVVPSSFVWFGEVCRWKLVNLRHWTLAGSTCPVRFSLRFAAPEVRLSYPSSPYTLDTMYYIHIYKYYMMQSHALPP